MYYISSIARKEKHSFPVLISVMLSVPSPAYQITYRLNSTNSNTATFDVLNSSARQYTVTGLRPESVYVFRIRAQTRKGWGEAAEALVVTTEKRGNTYCQTSARQSQTEQCV